MWSQLLVSALVGALMSKNHHLVLAADNSTSGPDDLAHCLCYKATSDGKIIPEDGATGSLCQQLHDGIPEQNFAGDPLYETYVSHPGTEAEEVHCRHPNIMSDDLRSLFKDGCKQFNRPDYRIDGANCCPLYDPTKSEDENSCSNV
ncbi:uncharacterized protein SEPMUDRAFT_115192 [Sphaerulina musiva SO2202]|uniref:Uncharacterized protein n=1 Tax=Sphaerulina musiva (strain SO2202) TaxID=692275 RepID=M3C7A5_SPHMS|nr:uncharacterized protein SEPMUDRAFT_115192 [Sphaerulina musiva SO2202]EMF16146.1 hypothetical protein SEPMUDRAFT_115192 [Sphaerulina musiva SO2202]